MQLSYNKLHRTMMNAACLSFIGFLILCLSTKTFASFPGSADEVKSLPGLNFDLNYRHYSGYLESLNGSYLHYWYFESQSNATTDPVVLWLNGGPGCSSVLGALTEQGPILIDEQGKLIKNKYAWNRRANYIFLEAPAGVGFSYNLADHYDTGDNQTAIQNFVALQSFFKKFPHLKDNDFYITGESYGGIYVPTLSVLVLDNKFPVNFKGFAIGNGYLDTSLLGNSLLHFAYYHGLFDGSVWNGMVTNCCANVTNLRYCDFVNTNLAQCKKAVVAAQAKMFGNNLNVYNIYGECKHSKVSKHAGNHSLSREHADKRYIIKHLLNNPDNDYENNVRDDPPCTNFDYVDKWINQKSVKEALHVNNKELDIVWTPCALLNYKTEYKSMKNQFKHLLDSGLKALIYNGDVDGACNFMGDQWFAEELGYKTIRDYQPWMVNGQIAGMVKVYEHFAFTTIRGSGHMVPTDRPAAALQMFHKFLDS